MASAPTAFLITATSIFFIGIMASKACLALLPALRVSVNAFGVICQDTSRCRGPLAWCRESPEQRHVGRVVWVLGRGQRLGTTLAAPEVAERAVSAGEDL